MPIMVDWHDRDKIIMLLCTGNLSSQDIIDAANQVIEFLAETTAPRVHLCVDYQVTNFPNFVPAREAIVTMLQNPKMGYMCVVGMDSHLAFWVQFFSRVAGLSSLPFANQEEAVNYLYRVIEAESTRH